MNSYVTGNSYTYRYEMDIEREKLTSSYGKSVELLPVSGYDNTKNFESYYLASSTTTNGIIISGFTGPTEVGKAVGVFLEYVMSTNTGVSLASGLSNFAVSRRATELFSSTPVITTSENFTPNPTISVILNSALNQFAIQIASATVTPTEYRIKVKLMYL